MVHSPTDGHSHNRAELVASEALVFRGFSIGRTMISGEILDQARDQRIYLVPPLLTTLRPRFRASLTDGGIGRTVLSRF
jgi:hypothetical protein